MPPGKVDVGPAPVGRAVRFSKPTRPYTAIFGCSRSSCKGRGSRRARRIAAVRPNDRGSKRRPRRCEWSEPLDTEVGMQPIAAVYPCLLTRLVAGRLGPGHGVGFVCATAGSKFFGLTLNPRKSPARGRRTLKKG